MGVRGHEQRYAATRVGCHSAAPEGFQVIGHLDRPPPAKGPFEVTDTGCEPDARMAGRPEGGTQSTAVELCAGHNPDPLRLEF